MKRDELIDYLKKMPDNVEVKTVQRADCCCGECFLPLDGENDVWAVYDYGSYILIG